MALFAKIKTWAAGDKLTATDLNAEFTNIEELLDGTSTDDAVKVVYNAADIPVIEASSGTAAAHAFTATVSGAGASGLVVNDGSSDVIDLKRDGTVSGKTLESTVSTGTAPLTVASSTVVTNLNADLLDGVEGSAYLTGTGDQTITRNSANLTWEWASDTGVILKIHETSTAYEYRIVMTGDDLEFDDGTTTQMVIDAANQQVEFPTNVELQGNNSATIYPQDDGTITPDMDNGSIQTITLAENTTISNLSNAQAGGTYIFIIKQDGVGGFTLSWGANFLFPGGTTPTMTSAASSVDIYTVLAEDSSTFYVTSVQNLQ